MQSGASAYGVEHLLGDCYEWTASDFAPYRPTVAWTTFRNWDHPYRRQIFAGVRVAYNVT